MTITAPEAFSQPHHPMTRHWNQAAHHIQLANQRSFLLSPLAAPQSATEGAGIPPLLALPSRALASFRGFGFLLSWQERVNTG